jgi:hypothetical protein
VQQLQPHDCRQSSIRPHSIPHIWTLCGPAYSTHATLAAENLKRTLCATFARYVGVGSVRSRRHQGWAELSILHGGCISHGQPPAHRRYVAGRPSSKTRRPVVPTLSFLLTTVMAVGFGPNNLMPLEVPNLKVSRYVVCPSPDTAWRTLTIQCFTDPWLRAQDAATQR